MTNKIAFEAQPYPKRPETSAANFGGILMVMSGDFRQILPVIAGGTRINEVNACIKSSRLCDFVETHSLTRNMRAHLHGDHQAAEFSQLPSRH